MNSPIKLTPRWISILALACGLTLPACGTDLFTYQLSIGGPDRVNAGVNDLRDFLNLFDDESLSILFPSYQPGISAVQAQVNLRGANATLSYDASSTVLKLSIPILGINIQFQGGTRDESKQLFHDWLRGAADAAKVVATEDAKTVAANTALDALLHGIVQYSPVDPVAGNPNSLQSQMIMADYDRATTGPRVKVSGAPSDSPTPGSLFRLDANYGGSYQGHAYQVDIVQLAFGGVINFPDRHWALILDWPMMATFTEGSESGMLYPGVGVQYRVNDWWSLTAFGRGGAVGSVKVGALAAIYSGTLSSYMRHDFGKIAVGWGITGGYIHTIDGVNVDNYDVSYNIGNYPLRTGLDVSGPFSFDLFGKPAAWMAYGNYTHLFGDQLYMQEFYETGLGFRLTREVKELQYDWMRLTGGYLWGPGFQGVTARLTFNF